MRVGGVDIVDLEPHRHAVRRNAGLLLQEDCEPFAVVQCGRAAVGNLELDLEPERRDIPVARALEIADGEIEMIELHHRSPPRSGE